jgi:predicted MFS family arabinose efflux permease
MALPHPNWVALTLTVILAALLIWWERRATTPFFDIRELAANGALARTYLRTALTLLGAYAVMYGVTQWLEAGRGLSSTQAGLLLLPMGALSALVSWPLSRRNLVRGPLIIAAGSMLVGAFGIVFVTVHSPVILIVAVMLLFGLTICAATVGNQTSLYVQAPADQIGTASGLFRTFGYLGSIASAAITGIVFAGPVTDPGLHTIAVVLIVAGAVVLAMTLLDRRLKTPAGQPSPPATQKENNP